MKRARNRSSATFDYESGSARHGRKRRTSATPATLKIPAKLAAEWRAKLAASGFDDIERGADPDGPLSNRHTPHESGEDQAPLVDRIEDKTVYLDWASDVLRKLTGRSAPAKRRRKIWALHAGGHSLKEISRLMGATFWNVRETVIKIQAKYRRPPEDQTSKANKRRAIEATIRTVSTATLASLAATIAKVERKRT